MLDGAEDAPPVFCGRRADTGVRPYKSRGKKNGAHMRWRVVVIVAWGVVAMGWSAGAAADDVAGMGVNELEARVLESRGALKSGEFEFRIKSNDHEIDT